MHQRGLGDANAYINPRGLRHDRIMCENPNFQFFTALPSLDTTTLRYTTRLSLSLTH